MTHLRPYSRTLRLPSSAPRGKGYLYLAYYTSKLVKVGSTIQPVKRLREHNSDGEAHGVSVAQYWLSTPTRSFRDYEAKMIGLGRQTAKERRKAEYFVGVDPEWLITETLAWNGSAPALEQVPQAGCGSPPGCDCMWCSVQGLDQYYTGPQFDLTPAEQRIHSSFYRRRLRAGA